jgi:2-dehydro-3-deoxyphosphogluconate aldolase/(4S)-4-hydroxy-2-oxoglutarate aldolase
MSAAPESLLRRTPVIPVVTLDDATAAPALARALADGGIGMAEFTLRTPAALAAIERVARELPDFLVGVGTVRTSQQLAAAADAGARFAVSPGATTRLLDTGLKAPIPYLPAVATASELMSALDAGYTCLKFFPAVPSGGVAALAAYGAPFPEARFCPTGGITPESAPAFLRLENVPCVGGSWLTPRALIERADWPAVSALAAAARALRAAS